MTNEEVAKLEHGLYVIHWKHSSGEVSVAAVGSDSQGNRWYAATNWIIVPCWDWKEVDRVELITTQRQENDKRLAIEEIVSAVKQGKGLYSEDMSFGD